MDWFGSTNEIIRLLRDWSIHNMAGLLATAILVLAVITTFHILLNKRDARAAATWVGLVWLVPALGILIYLLLGVNRIQRRARSLTGGELDAARGWRVAAEPNHGFPLWQGVTALLGELTGAPLTGGNDVEPLSPPEAMDAMVAAVNDATQMICLCTYIFGNDAAGRPMVDALIRAHRRGVEVRVLIDGFGSWYSLPSVVHRLKRAGVHTERFLYSLAPWRMPYLNLRNHRKLLVIDRTQGFVGGMNIRAGYLASPATTNDMHFRVRGPVVGQFLHVFAADWQFVTGELLDDSYAGPAHVGDMLCRGIKAGPDADIDKRQLALLAAIGRADHSIRLVTPYFVPDATLQTVLRLAALRGVKVEILLPSHNNLKLVHWAGLHVLEWLVREGCEVYLTPPPFDHTKLMTVDGLWSMVGSGNWDARSLRLNFEFDMECYSEEFSRRLNRLIDVRLQGAAHVTLAGLMEQGLMRRTRNALAHLLAPYL